MEDYIFNEINFLTYFFFSFYFFFRSIPFASVFGGGLVRMASLYHHLVAARRESRSPYKEIR